jgi:hypothetical protein
MLMALSPSERVHMAGRMFESARRIAEAGIRHREPGLDAVEVRRRLFVQFYGPDFSRDQLNRIMDAIPALRRTS